MNKPTIVFFGSGPVAASSLELLSHNFNIEAVITKPRPPHHKGDVPVLVIAKTLNLSVLTVKNNQELEKLFLQNKLKSKLAILIDFGIIVTKNVIDYFPLGIINSHFSLLPRWRGADPITFSILFGDTKTGVSLMLLDKGMDTGKLLTQKTFKLSASITTPELTENLIELSNQLLTDFVPRYIDGKIKPYKQPHPDRATYSRKLTKSDGFIDWNQPAVNIERKIRAFLGWPNSRTNLFSKDVIVTKALATPYFVPHTKPGDVTVTRSSGTINITTSDGSIQLISLKPVGKREMTTKEFIAGYHKANL